MNLPELPPCPHLPHPPLTGLDHRHLSRHEAARDGAFYLSCLEYGHALWLKGLAARAVLCLDRAMGADLQGGEEQLRNWPMPYAAMAWFLGHTPPEVFIGNPRVHFQHYADRMNEPRRAQRAARAWACWALARRVRPEWPGDVKHQVREPNHEEIEGWLLREGLPGESALWRKVWEGSAPSEFSKRVKFS
jgi:hypothetical protein